MGREKLFNEILVDGDVAFIDLGDTHFAVIDAEDAERCRQFWWRYWTVGGPQYAVCRATTDEIAERHGGAIYLHRFIADAPKDVQVDHRDTNGLNNRKSNLRFCTHGQNQQNQGLRKNNTTGFKGVRIDKRNGRFVARITVDSREIHLGQFGTAEEAGRAYDIAAIKYHGEFARTNEILGRYQ